MMTRRLFITLIILFGIFISAFSQPPEFKSLARFEAKADSIITNGIIQKAFPGAQVLVAVKGEVIFHKVYGFHTYDSLQPVRKSDLYDLASVTKILGPLPLLMKLVEENKIDLDAPFSTYWPSWRNKKDKKDLTLREILSHQAGLQPYIVFLNEVMKEGEPKMRFLRHMPNPRFERQAYSNLWVRNSFDNKVYREIARSEVDPVKTYNYSGLAFLLFPSVIEELTGHSYSYLLTRDFLLPMDLPSLGYLPSDKGFTNAFVPTEYDSVYRKDLVTGWVHDENASLFGGISGNAGLFGTARDVYRFMQMYQNYGELDGKRYLKKETVAEFARVQYSDNQNRRGLGFDKPYLDNAQREVTEAYPAPTASAESFGHSGFTGTFVWADPKYHLVFVFLSNRVHPTRTHRNLYDLNIRISLHQLFYDYLDQ